MAKKNTNKRVEAVDYRHSGAMRKNIPPAKIASEGVVPKIKKVKYYYSPHLSPELRYDSTGKTDQLLKVCEKAGQYLTGPEKEVLGALALNNQPWMEWATKKEQNDRQFFEVDPIALHIHERVSAQAIVRAAMREDAQRDLFADPELPYAKEVQFYRHDIDWANRIILGDSLQVMSSLARRENLASKVQMIYIDPPYGVKFASNFQPLTAKLKVEDKEADLTREPEMVRAYRDTWQLGVHSYLAYLRDRIVVARELLTDTGSIFVQISNENLHRVTAILDEVFGAKNNVSVIPFKKTSGAGSISGGTKTLASVCDYLLWYAKDKSKVKYRQVFSTKAYGGDGASQYTWVEAPNGFRRKINAQDDVADLVSKGWRIFGSDNLTSSSGVDTTRYPVNFEGQTFTPHPGVWKTGAAGMPKIQKSDRLILSGKTLWYVRYIDDFPARPISNLWEDTVSSFMADKVYVVQTNLKIIERCMHMTTDPGDLILDPTCGSGTSAFSAEQWGRRWITIDTSRVAVSIARQRMLTAKYDFYKFRDATKGVAGNFLYKTVPHITLKSIAQSQNLEPIFAKYEPILSQGLEACNKALAQVSDKCREKLKGKLISKHAAEGKRAINDADERQWNLPKVFEHWTIPFEADPDWPHALQDAVIAYRKAWKAKIDAVNHCIEQDAEQEELVDKPDVVKGVLRVSGPFTVEGVRPEELSLGEDGVFDGSPNEWEGGRAGDVRDEAQNLHAYLSRMLDLIRKDGVTFPSNKHLKFSRVEALYEARTGSAIHAEGNWEGADPHEPNKISIAFGPQYGPVTAEQVEDLIRSSKRYDELVIAGFSFDSEASGVIQEGAHPKLKIHMAHIRPDVSPGMDGLLKDTPNSQLFTVFGQPEIKITKCAKNEVQVELIGVDVFDPLKGEVHSTGAEKVAAWFLDSDYDGRCFCITQAFFPNQDAWAKIAKTLGSQADEDAFNAFKGTTSLSFKPGKYNRIAVKVVDPRGNEVMAIEKLGEA